MLLPLLVGLRSPSPRARARVASVESWSELESLLPLQVWAELRSQAASLAATARDEAAYAAQGSNPSLAD